MDVIEERIQVIAKEIQEAKATPWTITKIIKALSDMSTTSDKKLRERALDMLKELDPTAATIYESFSTMRVHTSNERVSGFNRGNIIQSLIKETALPRTLAEKITLEVENEIKDSKIQFLTTGLIRELVNAKLIRYGLEDARNAYTRLGSPAYDVKQQLELTPHASEETREYNTLLVLPHEGRELHFEGITTIEDIEGFSHRPYAYTHIVEKKETLTKTILCAIQEMHRLQPYVYLPINNFGITYAAGAFVKTNKDAKMSAHLIHDALAILGNGFTTSVELFTHKGIQSANAHKLSAAKIANELLTIQPCVVGVDSKYCLKLIDHTAKNFHILNNSAEEYFPLNNNLFSTTQGISLFVNINLEKLAQEATDETDFFNKLPAIADAIKALAEKKRTLLAGKSYLAPLHPEEFKTGIGITSLWTASSHFPGTKSLDFANKTYREINKLFDDALLFSCTAYAQKRFSAINGAPVEGQESLSFAECLSSKKSCFTGKAASIKEVNTLIESKVKQIEFLGALAEEARNLSSGATTTSN